ncbi:hypothetical protein [Marinobacter xestospongiae]|uniref:Lipoprotein n=1 Tax=Marinobacter xestospongiae TaxID=994319 RepID=A0ABU3W1S9_9GAMM|nr:hypothetical protein [Marinobacter xestospongiae]MDV2080503.1 hypothetical protein [Marinobacter xestospongiae]
MKSTFVMTGSRGWSFFAPVLVAGLFLGGCGSDSDDEAEPDPAQPEPLELKSIDPAEFSSPDAVAVLAGTLFFDLASASSFDEDRLQAGLAPASNPWCNDGGGYLPSPPSIEFFATPFLDDELLEGGTGIYVQCVTNDEMIDGFVFNGSESPRPAQRDIEIAGYEGGEDELHFLIEGDDGSALEFLGVSHQKVTSTGHQRYSRWTVASQFPNPFGKAALNVQMQFGKRLAPDFYGYGAHDDFVTWSTFFTREVTHVGNSGNTEVELNGLWGIQWADDCGGGLVDLETLAPLQQTEANEPYIAGKLRLTATEKTADAELVSPDELVVTLDGVSRSYSKSDVNGLIEACVTQ